VNAYHQRLAAKTVPEQIAPGIHMFPSHPRQNLLFALQVGHWDIRRAMLAVMSTTCKPAHRQNRQRPWTSWSVGANTIDHEPSGDGCEPGVLGSW